MHFMMYSQAAHKYIILKTIIWQCFPLITLGEISIEDVNFFQ